MEYTERHETPSTLGRPVQRTAEIGRQLRDCNAGLAPAAAATNHWPLTVPPDQFATDSRWQRPARRSVLIPA